MEKFFYFTHGRGEGGVPSIPEQTQQQFLIGVFYGGFLLFADAGKAASEGNLYILFYSIIYCRSLQRVLSRILSFFTEKGAISVVFNALCRFLRRGNRLERNAEARWIRRQEVSRTPHTKANRARCMGAGRYRGWG